MGVFNHTIELNICNGILILPIKLNAKASNKATSPSEKSRFPAIKSAEKRAGSNLFNWIHFLLASVGVTLTEWIEDGDVDSVDVRMYEKRRDNQQQYVEFLRNSHAERVQKKVILDKEN